MCAEESVLRRLLIPDICFFRLPNLVFCLVELELRETLSVCISALVWLFAFPSPFLFLESIKKVIQSVLRRFLMPDIHSLF